MRRILLLLVLPLVTACETTPERPEPENPDDLVTITPDELEPMRDFVINTRRVIAAEGVRIETTVQFFESQMGYTRDLRYVERTTERLPDGTRVIQLKNTNTKQKSNIDPDLLPRVYFGTQGLEVRAYNVIRIYLRAPRDKKRPLFLDLRAVSRGGDTMMWVNGRLQHEKPKLHLRSELILSEERQEYVHKQSIG